MLAYELLARLRLLTLSGINDEGDLEWLGTYQQWCQVEKEEQKILEQ